MRMAMNKHLSLSRSRRISTALGVLLSVLAPLAQAAYAVAADATPQTSPVLPVAGANRAQQVSTAPGLDADDGILTANDIAAMNLDGVRLVMLSACETGLGKTAGGEGLLGLQRAFQSAGRGLSWPPYGAFRMMPPRP